MTLNKKQTTLIEDLIGFDTTSVNSNLDLITYVVNRLEGTGANIALDHNAEKTKANLIASIGPSHIEGGIILSGHTDTVPVTGQDWKTYPYKIVEENGKLFARGSADMKSFCALSIAEFERIANDHAKELQHPLHLVLTYDEEVGCIGAQNLITTYGDVLAKPDLVLVGEPTNLRAVNANKGIHCFNVHAKGHGCHSSSPDKGVNAIQYNARLVGYVNRIGEELRQSGIRDLRFNPPYSTVSVGTISGGSAVNVVADECVFSFETRPVPGDSAQTVIDRVLQAQNKVQDCFVKAAKGSDLTLNLSLDEYVSVPSFNGDAGHAGSKFLISLLDDENVIVAPFCTEAGVFQNAGWNTIVCGPGSIDQAHQPDEFITINQVERGADLISRVTQRCFNAV